MMPTVQKLIYDAARAFGYAYVSTDRDGTVNLMERPCPLPPPHRLALYPDGHLYDRTRDGGYRSVTFR